MGQFIDLEGQKFGRLTAISRTGIGKKLRWICKCDCGKSVIVRSDHLKNGATRSCGCSRGEAISKALTRHGMRRTRLYGVWNTMIQRCENENLKGSALYHDRGIEVCHEWHIFDEFKNWALKNGYHGGLTIDRIDNNGNYEPSNCRWVDLIVQANNKRTNRRIEYQGETKTLAQWAREFHIDYGKLWLRLKRGWDFEVALIS